MELEKIVEGLVRKVERRFYGKYRGTVEDIDDKEKLGRIRARVPSVLGNDVLTGWALPCAPYGGGPDQGFLFVPEVGSGVWIEFEEGDLEFPIWVGTFWSKPGGESELPKPSDSQSSPTSKIIKTFKKHMIELADNDDGTHITISEKDGRNTVTLNSDGVTIADSHDNEITMSGTGVVVKSNKIKLGGADATEPVVLGNKLMIWLATHIHPTSMGPSGPPTKPPISTDFCSLQNFTK